MNGFRKARMAAHMSVITVAKELGVTDAAVYQWETTDMMPNAKRLTQIAELYGCTVDELLKGD